jgi:hypothetical protein
MSGVTRLLPSTGLRLCFSFTLARWPLQQSVPVEQLQFEVERVE